MENETADDVIIKEGDKEDHIYEQQISSVSSVEKADTNGEFEPGIEQPVSVGNTDTNISKPVKDLKEAGDQSGTITAVEEDASALKETEGETSETGDAANVDVTEINFTTERDDGHESPAEIRKKQIIALNPAHTDNIPILKHDVPEYRKVRAESYLWLSLFVLIFFSRIFGAIALYKSIQVRMLFLEKKYEESEESSRSAKKWNIVGMIFCLCWVVLVVVLIKGAGLFDNILK